MVNPLHMGTCPKLCSLPKGTSVIKAINRWCGEAKDCRIAGKPRKTTGQSWRILWQIGPLDRSPHRPIQTATLSQSSIEVLHLPKPDFRCFFRKQFFLFTFHILSRFHQMSTPHFQISKRPGFLFTFPCYRDFIKCQPRMEKTPWLINGGGFASDFDGWNGITDDLGHWVPQHFFHFLREAQDQYQGTAQHGLKAFPSNGLEPTFNVI